MSKRLRLREFRDSDLDVLSEIVGDDEQMTFYPRRKTRDEAPQPSLSTELPIGSLDLDTSAPCHVSCRPR